ncbi:hypothetical protein [Dendrosporobacter sp. 1207_IL3150]
MKYENSIEINFEKIHYLTEKLRRANEEFRNSKNRIFLNKH